MPQQDSLKTKTLAHKAPIKRRVQEVLHGGRDVKRNALFRPRVFPLDKVAFSDLKSALVVNLYRNVFTLDGQPTAYPYTDVTERLLDFFDQQVHFFDEFIVLVDDC